MDSVLPPGGIVGDRRRMDSPSSTAAMNLAMIDSREPGAGDVPYRRAQAKETNTRSTFKTRRGASS